jgi:transcription termination/antitermination protein NusG
MKRWYVIQVYTGFEEVVKRDIEKQAVEEGLDDIIGELLVPTNEISSMFSGEEDKREKIFPGYIIIHMEMTGESFKLVKSNIRVTRFLGGEKPVPLTDKEIERIFSQMEGKVSLPTNMESFIVGSEVQISNGPFTGFIGTIDKIDDEKERLVVMVSIFGRQTPVELGFDQIKK